MGHSGGSSTAKGFFCAWQMVSDNNIFPKVYSYLLRFYRTVGVPWFKDKPSDWLKGSRVLGRVGPSVNSGALMSVVEVQGF